MSIPTGKLLKVTIFVKRRPELSEEEFHSHWSAHGPLVSPVLKRLGFLKYTQFHTTSASISILDPVLKAMGKEPPAFDGYAEFLLPDLATLLAAYTDPEYLRDIRPDEEYLFGKAEQNLITAGWEEVCLEDGKLIV